MLTRWWPYSKLHWWWKTHDPKQCILWSDQRSKWSIPEVPLSSWSTELFWRLPVWSLWTSPGQCSPLWKPTGLCRRVPKCRSPAGTVEKCNLLPYVSKIARNYHLSGGFHEDFLITLFWIHVTLKILTDHAKDFRVVSISSILFLREDASKYSSATLNEGKKIPSNPC